MSQTPKHRFPDLVRLHNQNETVNIVYGTFEEPTYYYAGTTLVPDTDAFTNTLRWYREDRYKSILCFTHYKNSLPPLYVSGDLLTSSILSWRMWGNEEAKKTETVEESDSLLADIQNDVLGKIEEDTPLGAPQKIRLRSHSEAWSHQIEEFLLTLESELGLSWQGSQHKQNSGATDEPILVIACSQWLLPNPDLQAEDFIGNAPQQNYFQHRWDGIVNRLKETRSRIVIIASHLLLAKTLCGPTKLVKLGKETKKQYEELMNLCTSTKQHVRNTKLDLLHGLQWWIDFGDTSTPLFMLPYLDPQNPYGENYKDKGDHAFLKNHLGYIIRTSPPSKAEDPMEEFNNFIGMEEVKSIFAEMKASLNNHKRTPAHSHFLLKGNPGTGKTVVAKVLASILYKFGIVKENKFTSITNGDLVAGHIGGTSIKTNNVIQKAYGGVLFIDEAHAFKNGEKDYDKDALTTLLPYMENPEHIGNFVVIFAGYPKSSEDKKDVDIIFKIEPGLASRIDPENHITLPDYSPAELVDIFHLMARNNDVEVELSESFNQALQNRFVEALQSKGARLFGNARCARKYLEFVEKKVWARYSRHNISTSDIQEFPIPS